jgi:phosphopantetheine--protein transferase-like protein
VVLTLGGEDLEVALGFLRQVALRFGGGRLNQRHGILVSGTEIRNVASITFDVNAPITTNQRDPHNPAAGTDPAKEALVKAMRGAQLDFGSWREVEVRHDGTGRNHIVLHGRLQDAAAALRIERIHVSLAHTKELAAATVVLESSEICAESVTLPS